MVGAEEKMSTELNTGADWEQSRRLVVHWHDMWSIQKRENEEMKEKYKDALLKYGSHASNCACLSDPNEEFDIPCTCGFSEVLT